MENDVPVLPEKRQLIHELTVRYRTTGLSPPEEEILIQLESYETESSSSKFCEMAPGASRMMCRELLIYGVDDRFTSPIEEFC